MDTRNTLRLVRNEYLRIVNGGAGINDAVEKAIKNVFTGEFTPPYINLDKFGDVSHIFYGDYVLFFATGLIYKKD